MARAYAVLIAASIAAVGCGARTQRASVRNPTQTLLMRSTGRGHPPLAVVVRDGDAQGAISVAAPTEGIAADRGALVSVSLAALVEERLAQRGVEATAVGGWNGWRLRALVATPAAAASAIEAVTAALLTPVAPGEPALAGVARKAIALGRRPLVDRALIDVAACTGEAYGTGGDLPPTAAELESWRAAAHGLGRIAFATAGSASLADAAAQAIGRGPPWPRGAPMASTPWPGPDARAVVYDASGEILPGTARIVVTARTASPERATAVASRLGDPRGPLASRLAALEAPARVRSVVATAHVDGGCVATRIDLATRDAASDDPVRIATAAALARQEIAVEVADAEAPPDLGRALASRASDPRDAAERAAWWSLSGRRAGVPDDDLRMTLVVGVTAARDASEPASADAIRTELDRATMAWHARVVEARTSVEQGQGETWVLLASTCGTWPEAAGDAGVGAAVAVAAASQAAQAASEARVEPFIEVGGVGILVHGPARTGESARAHARRLADVAARAFAADSLDSTRVVQARTTLLARATATDARALGALGAALAPAHPSWLEPAGTIFGLASASDEAVALRAATIRAGPLRVAVVANADAEQADVAVRAVDRWVARRPGESRVCPPGPALSAPRTGTYAVDLPAGAPSEVLLAVPLVPGDEPSRASATWLAAMLDAPDGLLARSLGADPDGPPGASLVRSSSVAFLGTPRTPALVIRLVASDAPLDPAVAQTRALLDRLRQGALREDDRARAGAWLARVRLAASLDPRARVIDLWRGQPASPAPSLEALRSFAAAALRDDALVIVAARPARIEPAGQPVGAQPRVKGRE
jgi:hypothetical protein